MTATLKVTCPKCGAEHDAGIRFCPGCGENLSKLFVIDPVCPECGRSYEPGDLFCEIDGSRLVSKTDMDPVCEICGEGICDGSKFCSKDGGRVVPKYKMQSQSKNAPAPKLKTVVRTDSIENIARDEARMDFSAAFDDSIEILKANLFLFLASTIVFAVAAIIIGYFTLGAFFTIASYFLMAIHCNATFSYIRNGRLLGSDFMEPLSKRFGSILGTALMAGIITVVGFLLLVIPGIYFATAYFLCIPILIDRNLGAKASLGVSMKIANKNFMALFGSLVIYTIVNLVGALPYGLGMLITLPFTNIFLSLVYLQIMGFDNSRLASDRSTEL